MKKDVLIPSVALFIVSTSLFFNFFNKGKFNFFKKQPQPTISAAPAGTPGFFGMFCHSNRADLMKDLGVEWVRTGIEWSTVQPQRDVWRWEMLNKQGSAFKKSNFKIVLVIKTGQSSWATRCGSESKNPNASCPPINFQDYYNFVFQLTSRLKGTVDYFVVENEVNTPFFWRGTKEEYLRLRQTAYQAVHAANTQAKVLDNGFASPTWGVVIARDLYQQGKVDEAVKFANGYFARQIKKKNKGATSKKTLETLLNSADSKRTYDFIKSSFADSLSFDIANFHYYEDASYLPYVVKWIKDEMKKNGYNKPIWTTEMGVHNDNQYNQTQVIEQLTKKHQSAKDNGVSTAVWYPLIEGCNPHEQFFGRVEPLYDKRGKILPAGQAYKNLVKRFAQ